MVLGSSSAHALCSGPDDPKDSYRQSKFTLLASVVSVGETSVRLKVIKHYNGKTAPEISIVLPKKPFFWEQPSLEDFKQGKTYLISTIGNRAPAAETKTLDLYPCDRILESN